MAYPTDALWKGLAAAIVFPLVGYALALMLYDFMAAQDWVDAGNASSISRQRTVAIIAICANVLPIQYFQRNRMSKAIRGLVLVTVVLAVVWLVMYGPSIFAQTG